MTLADLYDSDEIKWQNKRDMLPRGASVLAGEDGLCNRIHWVPREVVTEHGRIMKMRPVDSFGRTWAEYYRP